MSSNLYNLFQSWYDNLEESDCEFSQQELDNMYEKIIDEITTSDSNIVISFLEKLKEEGNDNCFDFTDLVIKVSDIQVIKYIIKILKICTF